METGSTTGKKTLAIVCTPRGFGGLEMNTLKQARTLEEKGWTVWLLVNELSPMYTEAAKYCSNITSVQQVSGGGEKPKARWIHKWLKEKNPAILFTPYNKDIKSLSVYKRFYNRKVKLVYQQHMKVGVKKRDLIHRLRYNMLDLWISPLPYLKEETIEKTTVPAEKIAVVPLGLETKRFTNSGGNQDMARQFLNLPEDAIILGVLGRIDPKKNQEFAVRLLAHLTQESKRNYHLLIMGNTTANEGDSYFSGLKNIITASGLAERVHLRPYQDEVTLFYKAIDVMLMPTLGETYGMVTLEAMLMKKPVLGLGLEGTAALLEGGSLGWLYGMDNIPEAAYQLEQILTGDEAADRIEAAYRHVIKHYQSEDTMAATESLLLSLLR